MCHTRDKNIWGQLVQSGRGQIRGADKYWSSPSLSEPLLPFVLYWLLLLPNWTKYGDKYFFPPFIGCHPWRSRRRRRRRCRWGRRRRTEIMFSYVEANRRSAASTFCSQTTTLLLKPCTVHWSPVWAPAVSSMWAVGGAVGPLYPLQCMLCIVGSAMQWVLRINVYYAVLDPAYKYCVVFLYSIHPWYCAQ